MRYNNYTSKISPCSSKCYVSYLANFGIRYPLFNIRYLLTSIFLFFCSITIAQIPDTIPTYDSYLDSLNANDNIPSFSGVMDTSNYATEIDTVSVLKKKKVKSPKKAAILGLAIPGAGHIYNKKYWKAPVIWGAFAGGVYAIQYNTSRHKLMKDAYCAKLVIEEVRDMVKNPCPEVSSATSRQKEAFRALTGQDLTGELPPETSRFDSAAIKRFRDSFDKNTQLSWIALIGGHLVLNGVWSYVDGHLNEFDIDEDLSLKLRPSFETIALSNASFVGASIVLEF